LEVEEKIPNLKLKMEHFSAFLWFYMYGSASTHALYKTEETEVTCERKWNIQHAEDLHFFF